jgi:hypothetical protein
MLYPVSLVRGYLSGICYFQIQFASSLQVHSLDAFRRFRLTENGSLSYVPHRFVTIHPGQARIGWLLRFHKGRILQAFRVPLLKFLIIRSRDLQMLLVRFVDLFLPLSGNRPLH